MALREPRERPYRLRPPGPFDLDEIARIEGESFPIPWKRDFFASELVEPHRYLRVLVSEDGGQPRLGGYLFAAFLHKNYALILVPSCFLYLMVHARRMARSGRSLWRLAIILTVLFGCGYFFTPLSKVKLGLDLRGGDIGGTAI